MLEMYWADRLANGDVLQRAKGERLLLKMSQNRRHTWTGHTVGHNGFVGNRLEGAVLGKGTMGRPGLRYLKGSGKTRTAILKGQWEDLDCET
jgi:hypothetical protein